MEKNSKRQKNNNLIYIFCAFVLVTVMAVGIISAIGTANKTEDPLIVQDSGEKDSVSARDSADNTSENDRESDSSTEDTTPAAQTDVPEEDAEKVSAPTDFYFPVNGYIAKDYNMSTTVFSLTMNDYRTHSGIDISAEEGAQVSAFADGVISNRYTDPFMGVVLEITHGGGYVSRYMNLSEEYPTDAEVGCTVYGGQTVACVGDTAALEAAEESHLHFEVEKDGEVINPLDLVEYNILEDEYED